MPIPPLLARAAAVVATLVLATVACALPPLLVGPTVRTVRALADPSADSGASGAAALLAVAALAASVWLAAGVAAALFAAGSRTAATFARTVPTRRLVDALVAVAVSGTISAGALPAAHAATSTSGPVAPSPPGHVRLEVDADGRFVVRGAAEATTSTTAAVVVTPTSSTSMPPRPAPPIASPTSEPRAVPTTTPTTAAPAPALDPPPSSSPSSPPVRAPRRHVVAPGEHLWSIARHALGERLGRVPTDAELVPYWRRVCDANRARLHSGDVDVVFPGEVLELPEP